MPFLRVIRDKRGYETTYLMHWYREGSRQRSRILYVFRTPGGVRVGRDPLDRAIQQEIEARHPDIAFDWGVVISNQQVIESAVEPRRPRRQRQDEDQPAPVAVVEMPRSEISSVPPVSRVPIPRTIEGATPDEQIDFLTRWHAIIRERIPLRTSDERRREALLTLADRLNPVLWTDADQITSGLQQAGEAIERLSRVFAKRRRRARRPSNLRSFDPSAARGTTSSGRPEFIEGQAQSSNDTLGGVPSVVEGRQAQDDPQASTDQTSTEPRSEPPPSES